MNEILGRGLLTISNPKTPLDGYAQGRAFLLKKSISLTAGLHVSLRRVPTAQGKQGKWQKKDSLSGKTQGILKFCQNTGNLVGSGCKFPDSKGKRYFGICSENLKKQKKRSFISLPSQFSVCNSHKSLKLAQGKLPSDRENTGNLKMQFEWVPCLRHYGRILKWYGHVKIVENNKSISGYRKMSVANASKTKFDTRARAFQILYRPQ